MAARSTIPIIILTGFLGSGKTTLLSKWMRAPEFSRAMVIVNELGEVGLDSHLVQSSSEAPVLLDNGCACCTGAENLNATLERMFWDRLHQKISPFDWIIIETSGAADPGALITALNTNAIVRERYTLAAIVSAFDAVHGPDLVLRRSECAAQILHADCVIITKTDIANATDIALAHQTLQKCNPQVKILSSAQGDVSAAAIAQLCSGEKPLGSGDLRAMRFSHNAALSQAFVELPIAIGKTHLQQALAELLAAHGQSLLRIKGAVETIEQSHVIVQWPPGAKEAHLVAMDFSGTIPPKCGLTLIADNNAAIAAAQTFLNRLETRALTAEKPRPLQEAALHAS